MINDYITSITLNLFYEIFYRFLNLKKKNKCSTPRNNLEVMNRGSWTKTSKLKETWMRLLNVK